MKDLLKLEFRKLKRQKSFYIILAIMVALVVLYAAVTKLFEAFIPELNEMGEGFGETISATGVSILLGFTSSSSGNFALLTSIFVAIVVCDEYESKLIKNIFARGYSRADFYFAKFIYLIVTTSIMFLIAAATAGISGALFFGLNGDVWKIILLLDVQYLVCMANVAMFFALCVIIKKLGASIALCIFAPILVSLVLTIIDSAAEFENFNLAEYWLSSLNSNLSAITAETKTIIICAVLAVVYAIIALTAGYFVIERTEV